MRVAFLLIVTVVTFLMRGCCEAVPSTPNRPASVRGWQKFNNDQGIHAIGEFILKKGESTENGKFGVELIKTIASEKCSGPFAENDITPRAVVRIYEVANKRTLAEIKVRDGTSSRLININFPTTEYGVGGIFPYAINTKDEWIWFELWD